MTERFRIPDHVVLRSFPSETIVLNLDTGVYHGLNPTAARMLEGLVAGATARDFAAEYGIDEARAERDLTRLVGQLRDRGLIVADADGG